MTALTPEQIRAAFPALRRVQNGFPVAFFDGPGGTQVPDVVAVAMSDYLLHHNANTHWNYPTSRETDGLIAGGRQAVADFANARPEEVVFGQNMTTLTFHLARALGRSWGPGDEVVITELDHHGNQAPWTALVKERGITIRAVPFRLADGTLDLEALRHALSPRTRLVAVGGASNALGTINPIAEICGLARKAGALSFVDLVHYAPHVLPDFGAIGCDAMGFSPYKFYGPHQGCLVIEKSFMERLDVPKLDPAPNEAPERFETGTMSHEGIVGTRAAIDFLAGISPREGRRASLLAGYAVLHERAQQLVGRLWDGLGRIQGVRLFGPPPTRPRTPTVAFVVDGKPSSIVAAELSDRGLFLSHGDFYAATVIERLGLAPEGVVRAGCSCFATGEEVERLVEEVGKSVRR
ncbi:MAG: cysteine desulfurase-like protein [Gemmatimonadota bacterium]